MQSTIHLVISFPQRKISWWRISAKLVSSFCKGTESLNQSSHLASSEIDTAILNSHLKQNFYIFCTHVILFRPYQYGSATNCKQQIISLHFYYLVSLLSKCLCIYQNTVNTTSGVNKSYTFLAGTEVAKIDARDADSGDYGRITFLLDRISSLVRNKCLN